MATYQQDYDAHMKEAEGKAKKAALASADTTGFKSYTSHHWYRTLRGHKLSWWPSTGTFEYVGVVFKGVDIHKFITLINATKAPTETVKLLAVMEASWKQPRHACDDVRR